MGDYADYLRAMADAYDVASPDLEVEEKPQYDGYSDWAQTYDHEPENPVIAGEDLVLPRLLSPLRKATVLDVGAGTGRHAVPLARAGSRVTAVEPNDEMLSRAKQKTGAAGLTIEFMPGDAYCPLDDARVFDLVLCCLVLSHVSDLRRAIGALAARVDADGHLVVTDFHPYNLLVGMRTSYGHKKVKYNVPNSIHLPSEYVELAVENGLSLVSFHESGCIPGFPRMPATLVFVFARRALVGV